MNGNGRGRDSRGWLSLGAQGFCYDVSRSFVQMLHVHESSFLGRNWLHLIHVEDRQTIREIADRLCRQEIPYPVRMRWLGRYTDPVWLEVRFLKKRDRRAQWAEDRIIANVRRIRPEAA